MLNNVQWVKKFNVPTLQVPSTFQLAGGRSWLIPILSVSTNVRVLCMFPAILLTALFFMDQNISVRVVNNPERKLKKGPAYNIDMVALGLITAGNKYYCVMRLVYIFENASYLAMCLFYFICKFYPCLAFHGCVLQPSKQ